jgi:hypothetical protein
VSIDIEWTFRGGNEMPAKKKAVKKTAAKKPAAKKKTAKKAKKG